MPGSRKKNAAQEDVKQSGSDANARANGAGPAAAKWHGIDVDLVRSLIAAVDDSGIDSLEISRAGMRIRISKTALAFAMAPAAAPAAAEPARAPSPPSASPAADVEVRPAADLYEVKSPMVGTFYRAPAPEAPAYVEVGSTVTAGQTLCILEAMKLMNELESDVDGVVREILVDNADPVEYGQILFRVEKTGSGA